MNRPSTNPEVNVETLKLLLQVAWADDTLEPAERAAVADLGAKWGLPADLVEWLLKHLDMGKPLPQPNLALLRQHRDVVLAAAVWFVGVDGVIDEQEKDFLVTVTQLLGG